MNEDQLDRYIKVRYDDWLEHYKKKGDQSRIWSKLTQAIVIVSGALTPVAVALTEVENSQVPIIFPIVLSSIIAIAAGIQTSFNPQEAWIRYRTANFAMLRTKLRFDAGIGIFDDPDSDRRRQKFVDRIERIIAAENNAWAEALAEDLDKGR